MYDPQMAARQSALTVTKLFKASDGAIVVPRNYAITQISLRTLNATVGINVGIPQLVTYIISNQPLVYGGVDSYTATFAYHAGLDDSLSPMQDAIVMVSSNGGWNNAVVRGIFKMQRIFPPSRKWLETGGVFFSDYDSSWIDTATLEAPP
jgi:hypothetical protein